MTDHDTETADPYPHLLTTRLERRLGRVVLAATCRPGGHFQIAAERAGPIRMLVHGVRVASAAAAGGPRAAGLEPAARRRRARRGPPLPPASRRRPPRRRAERRSRTRTWCSGTRTILPVTTTIERLCADALVDAARPGFRRDLEHLLEETADAGVTRFVWLRQFEWELFLADAVVETHDLLVGRTYREAARVCEAQLGNETAAVRGSLRAFAELGTALLGARDTGGALDAVTADDPGWEGLGDLVTKAAALASTAVSDPLNHVLGGYSRFRRYTPTAASKRARPRATSMSSVRSINRQPARAKSGRARVAERPVVPVKPGKAGGGKEPQFGNSA